MPPLWRIFLSPSHDFSLRPVAADLIALRACALQQRHSGPARSRPGPGLPGQHTGALRGRGLDFAELRAYQPGDDVRSIDWRRSARQGQPCTKVFHAERERVLRLLVDLGPGMQFGTRAVFKSVAAARCATVLAWQAEQAGDRVAGIVGQNDGWHETPPRARGAGVLALIRLLAAAPVVANPQPAWSFSTGLQRLARHLSSGDRVVICSDFRQLDTASAELLVQVGRRADCLLVSIHDPFEAEAPPPGHYALTDGRHEVLVDFADPALRQRHVAAFATHMANLQNLALDAGARLLPCATDTAAADFLARSRG